MKFKFLNSNTKKIVSVLCAVAILMCSLPLSALLLNVNAVEGDIIDFQGENSDDIVAGNDHFTIGGQNNSNAKYLYVNNSVDDFVTLKIDGLQLEAGKKYTVDMDIYAMAVSKYADDKMFGIKVYGDSEISTETFVYNSSISVVEWTNFHFTFTAKEGSTKLDFSVFDSAMALIEDFTITDENGKKVDIDLKAACTAYGRANVFGYGTFSEITSESMKPTGPEFNGELDHLIYFDNSTQNTFWLTSLGMQGLSLPKDNTYKVEFDVYALTLGYRVVFNGVKAHMNTDHAIPNGQVWNEAPTELYKWTHYSFNITTTENLAGVYFHVLSEGSAVFKGYLANFKVKDTSDNVVFSFDPDASYLGKTSNGAKIVESPKEITAKTYPAYKLTIDKDKIFTTSDITCTNSVTYSFDYYITKGKVTAGSANVDNLDTELTSGVGSYTFTGDKNTKALKLTATKNTVMYIWNVKIVADDAIKNFANNSGITNCEFKEIVFADIPGVKYGNENDSSDNGNSGNDSSDTPGEKNYAIFIDNANGSGKVDILTSVYDSATMDTKIRSNYKIKFDAYVLSSAKVEFSPKDKTNATKGTKVAWTPAADSLNKWQTVELSVTITKGATIQLHRFDFYAGFKGYIDNIQVIPDGETAPAFNMSFTEADLGKYGHATKENGPVVEFSPNGSGSSGSGGGSTTPSAPIEPQKYNYAIYIDNSANTIQSGQIWFNILGAPKMSLETGKTYTLKFDNYALNESSGGHLYVGVHDTGMGITGQNWFNTTDKLKEWATQSVNFTPEGDKPLAYHTLHVGAGFKGYLDNFRVYDGDVEVATLTFSESNLGNDSGGAKVVKLPAKIDREYVPSSNLNGLEIAILKGKADKDGASINLGGEKCPLTLESNKTYKLNFKYYQANPADSGVLNLFSVKFNQAVLGKTNDIALFKKNSTEGWTEVKVLFSTGNISSAVADWFEINLSANAWVFFDDFTLEETELDNNKEVTKLTFEDKDDSIYPYFKQAEAVFEQSNEMGGTFKVVNSTKYTNENKNSNQTYFFKGIKMKSNTTYKVTLDYYVENPFTDYAAAFGYDKNNLGIGSDTGWSYINNIGTRGWHTITFTVKTGEVVPNAQYFKLVIYDVNDSSEPRTIWFDNFTLTEQYSIETLVNDATLGTVTKSFGVKAGDDTRVVANAFEGATFEGWYEYGDLVSTNKIYRLNDVSDNHKLEARFSGKAKPGTVITQGFENYELGDIGFEYYEIVNDPKNVLEGKQSLHAKPGKIMESIETSIFFPVVSNKEFQMKDDYTYDVYVWIKPAKPAENVYYYSFLGANTRDQSDLLQSGEYAYIGVSTNIKPQKTSALEENNGWYKYLLGTITKDHTDKNGFAFQICKFHANRNEGASIDDIYIDRVEVVERTPDFENLKYTEKFFNEISNSNFEEEVTDQNWGPLTDGATIEKFTKKEHDWQGNFGFKFDAAASNGKEYVRIIPIAKLNKNYTFAAWTKLSKGSDITVGLYSDGNYTVFENVKNGETGKLPMKDDGKWNRVNFSFNSGNAKNAYLVIKGTKGTLELDMVELFVAERGFKVDPNTYGDYKTAFQETDPIAFPDKVITEEVLVEDGSDGTNNRKYLITKKWVGPSVLVIVLSIVGGVLVLAAAAVAVIIVLAKKRKKN